MDKIKLFLKEKKNQKAAIFLSRTGTNAEKILECREKKENPSWEPAVIITDAPDKSRASEIAKKFNIPLVSHDIKYFYKNKGLKRVSIKTEIEQKTRQEWTEDLRNMISRFDIDFGILAGFIPLTNITSDFPCLNVHPGDLTVEQQGKRLLVGLHTLPIERAIISGFDYMRSSVIIAQTYTGSGGEMDSGPILGISDEIPIDLCSYSRKYLIGNYKNRSSKRPQGGYNDILEKIARHNQEQLKIHGDWVVFPKTVNDFAKNRFSLAPDGSLFYRTERSWKKIHTVIYRKNVKELI
ncbi:MAG: hypothetical protein K9L78_04925 [Victivallales bacterium]|nr:hypothetical protein [Victivallales bacterium]MCF7889446.1 hypothetical protein [Victivallales bacterium]